MCVIERFSKYRSYQLLRKQTKVRLFYINVYVIMDYISYETYTHNFIKCQL